MTSVCMAAGTQSTLFTVSLKLWATQQYFQTWQVGMKESLHCQENSKTFLWGLTTGNHKMLFWVGWKYQCWHIHGFQTNIRSVQDTTNKSWARMWGTLDSSISLNMWIAHTITCFTLKKNILVFSHLAWQIFHTIQNCFHRNKFNNFAKIKECLFQNLSANTSRIIFYLTSRGQKTCL